MADKTYNGWDYTRDGAYSPRVKGLDKKKRQQIQRRYVERDTLSEINRYNRERGDIE